MNHSTARTASGILAFIVVFSAGSCSFGFDVVNFPVTVDSVSIPDSIGLGDDLLMRFWGRLGPDKCWMFDRADSQRDDDSYTVEFIGRHIVRDDCPQSPSEMDHQERLIPPLLDPFTVTVIQPNGPNIVRTVRVQ